MGDYSAAKIQPADAYGMKAVDALLKQEGLKSDRNLDYTCAVYNDQGEIVAAGSSFANTLRCLAVRQQEQGQGLMNLVVTHLIQVQAAQGNVHLFLYTKCETAGFFQDLGFYEITRVENQLVFMENCRTGFASYLKSLMPEQR